MVYIRPYHDQDAVEVGQLIADTYTHFNLSHIPSDNLDLYLGPFACAYSTDKVHMLAIADAIRSDITLVAQIDSLIAGVLRGKPDKVQSLFVKDTYQRQAVGRALVAAFEEICLEEGSEQIKVQATLFAVPFYLALGYKRSTGIRRMTSFKGKDLPYQPMKKQLTHVHSEDQV